MIECVARLPGQTCQLLYFTSTSLTADDRQLVVLGEAEGCPNLHVVSLQDGSSRQLTRNTEGHLRSYVYFDGHPEAGLGKASISLDPIRGRIFFLQGNEVRVVDLEGNERTLAEIPAHQVTGYTHVSADGTRLCVPTTDARAFEVPDLTTVRGANHAIDARVQALGLSSWLRIYDTATGQLVACEEVRRAWVTHVQFSPVDPTLVLYNHEWPADCGIRRMWLWDGREHRRLRNEGGSRRRSDWTCHEMWERDGSAVIYHGIADSGLPYLGRVTPDGTEPVEIALPEGCTRYGHFTVGADAGTLVTDGYYRAGAEDVGNTCPWICRVDVDWQGRALHWEALGRADSSWNGQDNHPHPIVDHAGGQVYFTSDRDGQRSVYRLELHPGRG